MKSLAHVFLFILSYFILHTPNGALCASLSEDNLSKEDVKKQLLDVKTHLEKFNSHYLLQLEQRMLNILTTMTSVDSNVKTLQEKSQVWDVFQHHIGAWSDHIKSVDEKIELLKKAHESTPHSLDNRLSNLDFKVQHIFDKVNTINEKLHDITKTVYALSSTYRARRNDREPVDQEGVMAKISSLQKQLNRLETSSTSCHKKNGNCNGKAKKEVQDFEDELDDFFDKLATKKLKDLVANRKHGRSLDNISSLLRSVDERTIRIYDLEANQFEQILSCCKRTDHEITTFTNSADILLKRIERLVIAVDGKIEQRNNQQCVNLGVESTESEDMLQVTPDLGSGDESISTTTEKTLEKSKVASEDPAVTEFNHPHKQGCHQLTARIDEVYNFGQPELNNANRNFNRRFCKFATDGSAWTVIQRRELHDLQENFNRSWNEYKNGFGDLSHEFWFGNSFIHMLTYDDNVELRIEIEDFDGNLAYAEYKTFRIDTEKFNFNLMISDYQGNASDAMAYHNDQDFSTYDVANDKSNGSFPCALTFGSGWWFNNCAESNLNGRYYTDNPRSHKYGGVLWETWKGDYSLKSTSMMIRTRENWSTEDETDQLQDP
ncbi:angiopoietin-2-like [Malaya genurostris]|uniref:angiopoietin-2-like n=1 Tax=Malaya genurostris TaxID=325434 RepID=UPI0026F3EDD2|nr:angiopoietin-2-like [Malaya genurostris]XP_058455689.1 angiopoietin-2-like [Malaya genurostris]